MYLPSDQAAIEITKRAILIKNVYELIGSAPNIQELAQVQNNELMKPWAGKKMKVRVDTIDKKMKSGQIIQIIEQLDLSALGEPLNVDLKNAEVSFYVVKDPLSGTMHFGRLVAKTRVSKTNTYFQNVYDNSLRPY